jgi:hypothetical protein
MHPINVLLMKKILISLLFFFLLVDVQAMKPTNGVWPTDKAWAWSNSHAWIRGCNFIPSTAINQIEMWQAMSFDPKTIDKELGWAQEIGFNTIRVFLSSRVGLDDSKGLLQRMDQFLTIADKHAIKVMFCFFDDCWNPESALGVQPAPRMGIHNSGWVRDPSVSLRKDTITLYPKLETYVKTVLNQFKNDSRVLLWDLYNEPGNSGHGINSLSLLRRVFSWARAINPSQPITSGIWYFEVPELNLFQVQHSDVISYHNYSDYGNHETEIRYLSLLGRPMVCSEYMARKLHSTFESIMPLLKKYRVGAINWGFVSGKTNTIHAWDEPRPQGGEPELWFHDIFRADKTPFSQNEVDFIKSITKD